VKHFPAARWHPPLAGLSHSRPARPRATPPLLAALFYAAGFFTGAILAGEILLRLHTP
jgi:hypothetical protein